MPHACLAAGFDIAARPRECSWVNDEEYNVNKEMENFQFQKCKCQAVINWNLDPYLSVLFFGYGVFSELLIQS